MYTPESYITLIESLLAQEYNFLSFDESVASDRKCIYLRHDIDYSPKWAADFAAINKHCGVIGTFCFQLRSPLYNLGASQSLDAIAEIESLGQNIALHFSFIGRPPVERSVIVEQILKDFDIARKLIQTIKPWFSWHNPSLIPGLIERCHDLDVPDLLNLYSGAFVRDILYKSDSNWLYTLEEWEAIAKGGDRRMQLLFHPFQWMARGRDMNEVLALTYAEILRAGQAEFATNRVWKQLHPHGTSEDVYARTAALLGVPYVENS